MPPRRPRRARLVVFTVLILAGIAAGVVLTAGPQTSVFSPGPLSDFHAVHDDEASGGCLECHVGFSGLSQEKCLTCHDLLARRITAKQGYHAKVEGDCFECHSEHHGRETRLIRWPLADAPFKRPASPARDTAEDEARQAAFPHEPATGFALAGAHAKLRCEQCHSINLVMDPALIKYVRRPDKPADDTHRESYFPTYMGLGAVCGNCHQDPHVPSMGPDCKECHSEDAWSPSPNFVHQPPSTRYALEGKHKDVACEGCHITQPAAVPANTPPANLPTFQLVTSVAIPPVFRGVGFGKRPAEPVTGEVLPDCFNCHAQPHRNSPAFHDCDSCHTAATWKPMVSGRGFDHDKTGFSLDGAHARTSCADCHGKAGPLELPERKLCSDCHEDVHKGAFDREMALSRGKNCALCHGTEKWKPSTYLKEQHPREVPLIDAHAIRCEDCHGQTLQASCALVRDGKEKCTLGPPFARLPAEPGAPVGALEKRCQDCHADPHPKLTAQDPSKGCIDCHNLESWHDKATLDMAGHAAIGFPVRGAHVKIFNDCGKCHGGRTASGGIRQVSLSVGAESCYACHQDDDVHKGQLGRDCASCHNETVWNPSTFDLERHQTTRFPLRGGHLAAPCEACHTGDNKSRPQQFKWKQLACVSCHETPHGNQFRGKTCESCHTEQAWAPSTFGVAQHAKTRFPLTGAHDTACGKCHVPDQGSKVDRYENLWRACARCHEDVHAGQFTGRFAGCEDCHQETAWKPVTYDHERSRFPLRGAHAVLLCERCHQVSERVVDGVKRQVAHYYPIPGRACDDCHVNPHQAAEDKR